VCCLKPSELRAVLQCRWRRLLLTSWQLPAGLRKHLALPELWSGDVEDLRSLLEPTTPSVVLQELPCPSPPKLLQFQGLAAAQTGMRVYELCR